MIQFYQITDGQTGAQVAEGLQKNFVALESAIEETVKSSKPIILDPNSGIINTEALYNAILPKSYLDQYPWDAGYAEGLPWLWMNLKAPIAEGTQICVKKDNTFCHFANIPSTIGTVSEDGTVLTMKQQNNYIGFECKADLGVAEANINGTYQVYVLNATGGVIQELNFVL